MQCSTTKQQTERTNKMNQPFLALITPLAAPATTPPGIWGPGDPRPTNPIAGFDPGSGQFPPGSTTPPPPLVIWGPGDPRPTLPIAGWRPDGSWGIIGEKPPLGFWGPNDPRPSVPIAEPPWGWGGTPPPIEVPPTPGFEWKAAWTESTGWIVIGIPTGAHPSPSKGAAKH
jgi:hypothetical protein